MAVPSPLSTNVTPEGSAPVCASEGVGTPSAVTVNDPAEPAVNVVEALDVITGAAVDGQRERLARVGADAVRRRERQRVRARRADRGRARKVRRAVAVVDEGNAAGQCARLATATAAGKPPVVTVKVSAEPCANVRRRSRRDRRRLR